MRFRFIAILVAALCGSSCTAPPPAPPAAAVEPTDVLKIESGFVDANGVLIYYEALGHGQPLLILHGGPGASHDYFLPYLLPLARTNRVVFIDERGSGKSEKLEDPKGYTVENMVEDVEAVRQHLDLGKMNLLGHSFGGVLARGLRVEVPGQPCAPDSRQHVPQHESAERGVPPDEGAHDAGAAQPDRRDGEGGAVRPRQGVRAGPLHDGLHDRGMGRRLLPVRLSAPPGPRGTIPTNTAGMAWDLYREMWGSHGEFIVDGNLASVEYADRLPSITVPTLITVGDHDQVAPSISEEMHTLIKGSTLSLIPESGHMTFVDQPTLYVKVVNDFLSH